MANPLARLVPSKSASGTSPLPTFTMPPLPERLVKIAPEEAQAWQSAASEAVQQQFRLLEEKINTIIDAQRTGS